MSVVCCLAMVMILDDSSDKAKSVFYDYIQVQITSSLKSQQPYYYSAVFICFCLMLLTHAHSFVNALLS